MLALKALSALLAYPEAELQAALPEIAAALAAERRLPEKMRRDIARLLAEMRDADLLELQERYVSLFDRNPRLSLHLFEHVHGESRDRGMAMVELVGIYRRHGLEISSRELPDFLPLFLEYLSLLSEEEAMTMLGDAAGVLGAIESRLSHRRSSYAAIFATLRALAGIEEAATVEGSAEQFDDLAALDKAWEEAAVTFGPEQIGGSSSACDRAATMVARMSTPQRRPAP